jgi:hypothetical protein
MWETILLKLQELVDSTDRFAQTEIYEIEQFSGSPVAIIVPSSNENDYYSNSENVRIYAFTISMYVNRSVSPTGTKVEVEADRIMRNLIDSVLDICDRNYLMEGLEVPAGYTFINMFALPSVWGYSGKDDEYRVSTITVKCRVIVNVI